MRFKLNVECTGGELLLIKEDTGFNRILFSEDRCTKYFTMAWNTGVSQIVTINGCQYDFPANSLLILLFSQVFTFKNPLDIIAWQFNREFYCIFNQVSKVSSMGSLFSGADHLFVNLSDHAQQKLRLLFDDFIEEFRTSDNIQNEMMLVLLRRLIIFVTRSVRFGYIQHKKVQDERFHIVRKFNLLVETHFKTQHSVSFYADQLFKAPKTLSNLFAMFNQKTPSQIIQERIVLEAKRLLFYTDRSIKHITFELGFEDVSYFSNFFKRNTRVSPSGFRNSSELSNKGNNHNNSGNNLLT
jgi:AraC family transcriptional activator of pobA